MADENYSSLREAVNRIVGAPAGGADQAQDIVKMAPQVPYSQDTGGAVSSGLNTISTIANTPFDPFAEQNAANAASLAAAKATNDQLAAQVAPSTVAETPESTYKAAAAKAGFDEGRWRTSLASVGMDQKGIDNTIMMQKSRMGLLPTITSSMSDDQIRSQLGAVGATPQHIDATVAYQQGLRSSQPNTKALVGPDYYSGSATRAPTRPVNPGARAPWQASQQYWKDLEAYTKAGGK